MENRRFILIALLGAVLFFIYQAWVKDFSTKPEASAQGSSAPAVADEVPAVTSPSGVAAVPKESAPTIATNARVHVRTDVLAADIALNGGELRRVELVGYPVAKDQPNVDYALLDDRDNHWFVLQSGLATPEQTLSGPQTPFHAAQTAYELPAGADSLDVPLESTDTAGNLIRKVYRFKRNSYSVELVQTVKNAAGAEIAVSPYVRMWRTPPTDSGSHHLGASTFTGMAFYEQKQDSTNYRFRKLKFEDVAKEPLSAKQQGGWIAMMEHYFVAAVIPPKDQTNNFSAKPSSSQGYLGQYVGSAATVAPQAEHSFSTQIYMGPLLQKTLEGIAPGFDLAVDYGVLTPIAHPLFLFLNFLHGLTHNWGFAIILLTLAVKGVMYKLSEAQYRSMAKMKKFAPRIQELKERYADDRERMSKAMMELYKKEGFNPLAGCWPLVVQFPVFIALYWVLLQSVELRQAPFMLWINDLSAADPYFVLPVLFGISMFVQQKLSGQQVADPMQQKVMQIMPIMMTAFFAFFPAGLVLYWFVSNLTGISQQWYITRKLEKEGLGRKAS